MRAVAHELAAQYGLASQSYGAEPQRYVELFKTDGAGLPTKLLSRWAWVFGSVSQQLQRAFSVPLPPKSSPLSPETPAPPHPSCAGWRPRWHLRRWQPWCERAQGTPCA